AVAAAQAVERVAGLQEGDLAAARAGLLAEVGRRPVRVAPHTGLRDEGPGNVALYAADRDVEGHRLGVVAAVHAEGEKTTVGRPGQRREPDPIGARIIFGEAVELDETL